MNGKTDRGARYRISHRTPGTPADTIKERNSDSSLRLCLCFCVGGGWERGEEEQQQQQQRRILVEAPLPLHGPSGAGLKRSHGRPNGRQNKWMGSVREERRDGGGGDGAR